MTNRRFDIHSRQYIPETLMNVVIEFEKEYNHYKNNNDFNREFMELFNEYANRPSCLYYAKKLTKALDDAKIYLKRENLNHTGSHKINNDDKFIIIAVSNRCDKDCVAIACYRGEDIYE